MTSYWNIKVLKAFFFHIRPWSDLFFSSPLGQAIQSVNAAFRLKTAIFIHNCNGAVRIRQKKNPVQQHIETSGSLHQEKGRKPYSE